ncbi:3-deoxy-7-phosphoheptulonate synthase [Phenylobacterium haematophilum]|uniref:Phospho-2-dehydro-3-deoxyheptonate aldolase n=1 Tax=Phenylobacterium haematophilum TaxID=98513 RepID=A0A839ZXM9_9CAUL|nr:3-deoxy-7-phosphoheptulonate synthase [Phenylobacterium haematophilum]
MTTDDLRILDIKPLASPAQVMGDLPASDAIGALVSDSRQTIHRILHGDDDRLVVVIGPCSIHDPVAAMDYARRLAAQRDRFAGQLEIVMRVYFEKPRTTVGWKGLINDPHLDGTFRIDEGLPLARKLLLEVNALGLPAAVEFLDVTTPQYLADLVAWGAIGARTTESQIHREMASGLSCPIGFKNGTDGNLRIAVDAVKAASQPHHFLAIGKDGRAAIAATRGNDDSHVVLRGGKAPNYDAAGVAAACAELASSGLRQTLIIDVSHANSGKKPENQPAVTRDVAAQVAAGDQRIAGVMIESHLVAGRQDLVEGQPLTYGQSITDGCIDWDTSVELLEELALAVEARRRVRAARLAGEPVQA